MNLPKRGHPRLLSPELVLPLFLPQIQHEQPVTIAVGVDTLDTIDLEACRGSSFRIELLQLDPLVGHCRQERDVVGLGSP